MTESKKKTGIEPYLPLFLSLFALFLLLIHPREVSEGVRDGLLLCYRSVIPAIFPFVIVTELLRAADLSTIDKTVGRPIAWLFGVSPIGARAILTGALLGLPLGARMSAELYREQLISREEAERLLYASSFPSPAFLISGVGLSMVGDAALGVRLFCLTLLSSLIPCLLFRPHTKKPKARTLYLSPAPFSLSKAIASALDASLSVTATVTFFSMVSALLSAKIHSPILSAAVSSALEIGSGTAAAAKLYASAPHAAASLLAFASAFSGLSVYLQVSSVGEESGLSAHRYLAVKLLSGVIATIFAPICLA